MLRLVNNTSIGKAIPRRWNGRDYLVAPATTIVEGVLNGSHGALYYPASETDKAGPAWKGIPLTMYHPFDSSGGMTDYRSSPRAAQEQNIGFVGAVRTNNGQKLQKQLWFDVEKTRAADRRFGTNVLYNVQQGLPIGVSTGLFTEDIPAPPGANFQGRPFDYYATNHRPDHMAVLPNQVGACSLNDGCGVHMNYLNLNSNPEGINQYTGGRGGGDKNHVVQGANGKYYNHNDQGFTESRAGATEHTEEEAKSIARRAPIEHGVTAKAVISRLPNGERFHYQTSKMSGASRIGQAGKTFHEVHDAHTGEIHRAGGPQEARRMVKDLNAQHAAGVASPKFDYIKDMNEQNRVREERKKLKGNYAMTPPVVNARLSRLEWLVNNAMANPAAGVAVGGAARATPKPTGKPTKPTSRMPSDIYTDGGEGTTPEYTAPEPKDKLGVPVTKPTANACAASDMAMEASGRAGAPHLPSAIAAAHDANQGNGHMAAQNHDQSARDHLAYAEQAEGEDKQNHLHAASTHLQAAAAHRLTTNAKDGVGKSTTGGAAREGYADGNSSLPDLDTWLEDGVSDPLENEDDEIGQGDRPGKSKGKDKPIMNRERAVALLKLKLNTNPGSNSHNRSKSMAYNRQSAIQRLTMNCKCDNDVLALNALSDGMLSFLVANEKAEGSNADTIGGEGEEYAGSTEEVQDGNNPIAKKDETLVKDNPKGPAAMNRAQQWLATMPEEFKPVWNSAVARDHETRLGLAHHITSNVGDPQQRQGMINDLMNIRRYDEPALRKLASLIPRRPTANQGFVGGAMDPYAVPAPQQVQQPYAPSPQVQQAVANAYQTQQPIPLYLGANGAPVTGNTAVQQADDDVLDIPTLNFAATDQDHYGQHQQQRRAV